MLAAVALSSEAVVQGQITKIKKDAAYMFVEGADGTQYFAHATAFRAGAFHQAKLGDAVTFEATASRRGPRAESVELV